MNADTTTAKRYLPFPGSWPALWSHQRITIHLGLLGAAILFVYYRTFDWLLYIWWTHPRYSHGFLVPLIAAYLVWIKRDYLLQLPRRPNLPMGGLLLSISAILLLVGRAGGYPLFEAISLPILLPGIVLSIWGPAHLRAVMLPLIYLQFMIPWMEELIARVSLPFQLLSARLGAILLQAIGFSVLRERTVLQLPHMAIDVVSECSGIGYFISIVALGIPLVYFTQRTWWRAAGVLAFGATIVFPANGVRVALVGLVGSYFGESSFSDPLHSLVGLSVTTVGIVFLFLVNWAVSQLPCDRPEKLCDRWRGFTGNLVPTKTLSRTARSSALLIVLLLGFGYYLHFFAPSRPVPPKRLLSGFPYLLNGRLGRDSAWINGIRFFPGVDAEVIRTYHTNAGKEMFLYIGYFTSQNQEKSLTRKLSNPVRHDVRELPLPTAVAGLQRVNHSVPTIDGKRYEALSWYHLPSGNTTGRYETKLRQFLDAVIRGHSNGAVVLLATPAAENRDGTATVGDLVEFATTIAPVLEQYLP